MLLNLSGFSTQVRTPFVLVLQHDRPCLRPFDGSGTNSFQTFDDAFRLVLARGLRFVSRTSVPPRL